MNKGTCRGTCRGNGNSSSPSDTVRVSKLLNREQNRIGMIRP